MLQSSKHSAALSLHENQGVEEHPLPSSIFPITGGRFVDPAPLPTLPSLAEFLGSNEDPFAVYDTFSQSQTIPNFFDNSRSNLRTPTPFQLLSTEELALPPPQREAINLPLCLDAPWLDPSGFFCELSSSSATVARSLPGSIDAQSSQLAQRDDTNSDRCCRSCKKLVRGQHRTSNGRDTSGPPGHILRAIRAVMTTRSFAPTARNQSAGSAGTSVARALIARFEL
ncbi:hypothetical protein MKEN_00975500 [Mycena kentingensis (nom. inval.)]|nr:hypothetical protein MKEN_00975500 [Mycena kentingensis (nom. inval.)]